ncbi:hypothetical protein [[Hallella] seregens]|uniref:Uncharacterized protein n=1 Tax=Hallella seregens ATCC 51272 TaxID=1336250 RepID=A0ABV5ZNI6_9BACT|nr:hypothetical protein [Hallella seregens]
MAKSEGSRWVERGTGAGGAGAVREWKRECEQIEWGARVGEIDGKGS